MSASRITITDRRLAVQSCLAPLVGLLLHFAMVNQVSAQCSVPPADVNGDQHVDLDDYSIFADCLAGPDVLPDPEPPTTTQTCLDAFDSDGDDDVDFFDLAEFQVDYTGSFRPECYNRVFVSSTILPPNLGSALAYDSVCNIIARDAGLNNPDNDAFIAWVSDSNSNARTRLGPSARGFVRVDGVPVADSQESLFVNNAMFNPIRIDQFGNDVGALAVITGTYPDGTTSPLTCLNWTSVGTTATVGNSAEGPGAWTNTDIVPCQGTFRVYCIEKTKTLALTPPPSPGKRIYVTSSAFTPGPAQTPDQLCEAEKPPGVVSVRALIATTTSPADEVLDPESLYVRVDGQIVGTGAQLANLFLRSGIWQTGSGSYVFSSSVWTGSEHPLPGGTTASTCGNWTQPSFSVQGAVGNFSTTQAPNWWRIGTSPCVAELRLYCVEQ